MDIYTKMAYLKGMLEGMDFEDKKEKKLFAAMIDILDELVEAVDDLYEEQDELQEYVESIDAELEDAEELLDIIDEDLELVEDILGIETLEDECCDMDCDCEEGCACGCDDCEDEIIEVECPECGETVCFYDEMMDDEGEYDTVEILCPKCDAVVYTFESELIEDIDDEDIAF